MKFGQQVLFTMAIKEAVMFPSREEIAITLDNVLTGAMNFSIVATGGYVFLSLLGAI
tara:strand:+ start:537 stop:707 length:171 start_codon:yes stop_codon:yes gene_type:complete